MGATLWEEIVRAVDNTPVRIRISPRQGVPYLEEVLPNMDYGGIIELAPGVYEWDESCCDICPPNKPVLIRGPATFKYVGTTWGKPLFKPGGGISGVKTILALEMVKHSWDTTHGRFYWGSTTIGGLALVNCDNIVADYTTCYLLYAVNTRFYNLNRTTHQTTVYNCNGNIYLRALADSTQSLQLTDSRVNQKQGELERQELLYR